MYPEILPYELIGKFTVTLIGFLVTLSSVVVLSLALYFGLPKRLVWDIDLSVKWIYK